MDLTLIRHADVARGEGHADPPLSERGVRQAECLALRARRWKRPVRLYVSPARRAQQTAEPLAVELEAEPTTAAWLEEIQLPSGTSVDVARADDWLSPSAFAAFRDRVAKGLTTLLAELGATPSSGGDPPHTWQMAHAGERIVLVGHGMAQAVALEYLLGVESVPWAGHRFQFAHAAFARVRAFARKDHHVFGLVQYNDVDHVPRELRSY